MLLPRLCQLAQTSSALRCIVSLCWPLPAVSPSTRNAEMKFFLYRVEDLKSEAETSSFRAL